MAPQLLREELAEQSAFRGKGRKMASLSRGGIMSQITLSRWNNVSVTGTAAEVETYQDLIGDSDCTTHPVFKIIAVFRA